VIREDRWLAGYFGREAFRLDAESASAELPGRIAERMQAHTAGRHAAFYYAKVDAVDTRAVYELTRAGFTVVDVNVTLDRPPSPVPEMAPGIDVHDVRPEEHAAVLDIAGQAFRFSRYHLDPQVPRRLAHRLRREWVASYIKGDRGERLLAATVDGRAVGFLAVLAGEVDGKSTRTIDLMAVAPPSQGLGVGTALVNGFIRVASQTADRLRVGTQVANVPSLRLYTGLGFQIVHTAYVLHLHIGPPIEETA